MSKLTQLLSSWTYHFCSYSTSWDKGSAPGRTGSQNSLPGRVVNLRLDKFLRYFATISPIFRHFFFERTMLNLKWVNNKVQIFFKKSFKNTDTNFSGLQYINKQSFLLALRSFFSPIQKVLFELHCMIKRKFS